ncbi:MAG: hypothetical protein IIY21_22560 [Clostridiales bacterium]|nr:hypothetical protein [Clostridiales bacterium]
MRIVKALEILSAYCEKHKCCVDCRFGKLGMEECIFQKYPPCDWYDEYEKYLKKVLKGEDDE